MYLSQTTFQKILASFKCSSDSYVSPLQSSMVLGHKATNGLKSPMATAWQSYNKRKDSSKRDGAWSIRQLACVKRLIGAPCPKKLACHCVYRHHAILADGCKYRQPRDHVWTSNKFSKSVVHSQEYFKGYLFCQCSQAEKQPKERQVPSKSPSFYQGQSLEFKEVTNCFPQRFLVFRYKMWVRDVGWGATIANLLVIFCWIAIRHSQRSMSLGTAVENSCSTLGWYG